MIKNLRLTKYEAYMEPSLEISEDCFSPIHLVHLILTSWCPNLISFSILEEIKNWKISGLSRNEHKFPQFQLPQPVFKEKLKLESLTIKFKYLGILLPRNIRISYLKEIIRSCPNLKDLRTIWLHHDIQGIEDIFFRQDEDYGLNKLETLEIPRSSKDVDFLQWITPEKFPK